MPAEVRIVLDTNFIMIPGQFGVDIFDEFEKLAMPIRLYVCEGTIKELGSIIEHGKTSDRTAARVALGLIEAKGIKTLPCEGSVDDALVALSKEEETFIATQDKALRKRIGSRKFVLRQKKYIRLVR
jgi:uncharacterized protein